MTTGVERSQVAREAADALEALREQGRLPRALVGFDGFVDEIIHVVDKRRTMTPGDFDRIGTIPEFAARVAAAAGKSANIELCVREARYGGNGPLMGGALGRLGAPVTFIGAVGSKDDPGVLDPIYAPFAERCESVIPIAPPAHTDALEFTDGKIMLGKPLNVQGIDWDRVKEVVGIERMRELCEGADLIGVTNWVMLGGVESIWEGLRDEVFPALTPRARRFMVDLSDPAKRTDADIIRAMGILRTINAKTPVTLGLNLAESQRIAKVMGLGVYDDSSNYSLGALVRRAAEALRETLGLDTVVVHPREGAGGANAEGSAWYAGPFTQNPKLSTGAGDHFNGGFGFAQAGGLDLDQCLATGCAVSGAYVRDALSPDLTRLIGFLRDLPEPD
ncbi:MAG: carbohydrate kinase family protein [Phycisphaerales bacterium JB059]